MIKFFSRWWCAWQFSAAGIISVACYDIKNRKTDIVPPPNKILTPFGLCVIYIAWPALMSIYISKFLLCKITFRKFVEPDLDKIEGKIPEKIIGFLEKHSVQEHNTINYFEEYLYYKYYYKTTTFFLKRKWTDGMPDGLEDKYLNAHKNYLVAYLIGIDEEAQ